jgi:hypothetical protein
MFRRDSDPISSHAKETDPMCQVLVGVVYPTGSVRAMVTLAGDGAIVRC